MIDDKTLDEDGTHTHRLAFEFTVDKAIDAGVTAACVMSAITFAAMEGYVGRWKLVKCEEAV